MKITLQPKNGAAAIILEVMVVGVTGLDTSAGDAIIRSLFASYLPLAYQFSPYKIKLESHYDD